MNDGENNRIAAERLLTKIRTSTISPAIKVRAESMLKSGTVYGEPVHIADVIAEVERVKKTGRDYVVGGGDLAMKLWSPNVKDPASPLTPVLAFSVRHGTEENKFFFTISRTANAQIAEKTQIPKKYYDRLLNEDRTLLAMNVNRWLPQEEPRQLRTLDGKARALVSGHFRALDNADLFFAGAQEFANVGAAIVEADLTEDHFYLKAVSPDITARGPKGEIFGGIVLENSETGQGSLAVKDFFLTMVCLNGAIGERVFNRIHLGEKLAVGVYSEETINKSGEAVWLQARDIIRNTLSERHVEDYARKLFAADEVEAPKVTELLEGGGWGTLGITETQRKSILEEYTAAARLTQYGLAEAVTATAREQTDGETRAELQRMGYELATMNKSKFEGLMVTVTAKPRKAKEGMV